MKKELPKAGDVFTVEFPFLRDEYDDGETCSQTWKPGGNVVENYIGRLYAQCHGKGHQELTVVSVHQPPGFPTRVFYTRKWIDPDGKKWGKNALRIKTADAFRRTATRYAYEMVIVTPEAEPAPPPLINANEVADYLL